MQLRNPLHAMHGAIQQLVSGELDPAAAREEVASLAHGLRVMVDITNDLLDMEALRAGRLRVRPAPTELRAVLAACVRAAGGGDGGVAIALEVATAVPAFISVDALRLRQVRCCRREGGVAIFSLWVGYFSPPLPRSRTQILMNALSNAVKYTPLTATEGISVSASPGAGGGDLVITVADRGTGLHGQTLAQLRNEFSGVGSAVRQSAIRSSGLGIPICCRLAELMGGAIELADRGGGPGSLFTLRLPLHAVAAADAASHRDAVVAATPQLAAPLPPLRSFAASARAVAQIQAHVVDGGPTAADAPAAAAGGLSGTRVLVVDDSPANLRFAVFLLKRLGCATATATDGDEVVAAATAAAAAGAPFDVCVMDMYMQRLNGDGALAALRAAGHALPVLLCTGNATNADAERNTALGFAGQLGKPFAGEQLGAAITSALGSSKTR
jgi:CheY-like chemotaxis protein